MSIHFSFSFFFFFFFLFSLFYFMNGWGEETKIEYGLTFELLHDSGNGVHTGLTSHSKSIFRLSPNITSGVFTTTTTTTKEGKGTNLHIYNLASIYMFMEFLTGIHKFSSWLRRDRTEDSKCRRQI